MSGLKIATKDLVKVLFPGFKRDNIGSLYALDRYADFDSIDRDSAVERALALVSGVSLSNDEANKCEFCEGDGKVHAGTTSKTCPRCDGSGLGEDATQTLEEKLAEWFSESAVIVSTINDLSISMDCLELSDKEIEPEIQSGDFDDLGNFVRSIDRNRNILECYGDDAVVISKNFMEHSNVVFFNKEDILETILIWNRLHGKKNPIEVAVIMGPNDSDVVEEIVSLKTGEGVYSRTSNNNKKSNRR